MINGRHKHALVRYGDYVYALGGISEKGKSTEKCERYSITEDRWEGIAGMTEKRNSMGSCAA